MPTAGRSLGSPSSDLNVGLRRVDRPSVTAKFRFVLDSPTAVPGGVLSGRILAMDAISAKSIRVGLFASNDKPNSFAGCGYGMTKYITVNLERLLEPGDWVPFVFVVPLDLVPSVETDRVNLRWQMIGSLRGRPFLAAVFEDVQILPPGSEVPLEQRVSEKTLRQFRRREFDLGGWSYKQKRLKKVQLDLSSALVRAGSDIEAHVRNGGVESCMIGLLCHEWRAENVSEGGVDPLHALIFESWQALPLGESVVRLAVPPIGPPSYHFARAGVRWEVRVSVAGGDGSWEVQGPVQEAVVFV